jgi:hypothetical protein
VDLQVRRLDKQQTRLDDRSSSRPLIRCYVSMVQKIGLLSSSNCSQAGKNKQPRPEVTGAGLV